MLCLWMTTNRWTFVEPRPTLIFVVVCGLRLIVSIISHRKLYYPGHNYYTGWQWRETTTCSRPIATNCRYYCGASATQDNETWSIAFFGILTYIYPSKTQANTAQPESYNRCTKVLGTVIHTPLSILLSATRVLLLLWLHSIFMFILWRHVMAVKDS